MRIYEEKLSNMIKMFEKEFIARSSVTCDLCHSIKENAITNIDRQIAKITKWFDRLVEGLTLEK